MVLVPAASWADVPASAPDDPSVSGLQFLVVLLLIPLGLAGLIALLAALPSIVRDKGYQPGQSWRSGPEWFGGPTRGVEAADDVEPREIESGSTGGTSGRW